MQESLRRADRSTAVVFVRSSLTLIAILLLTILSASASPPQDRPGVLRPPIESQPISITISINEAVETADRRYPSIARSDMDTKLAGHEITVAKTQYLPRMDMLLQEMRALKTLPPALFCPSFSMSFRCNQARLWAAPVSRASSTPMPVSISPGNW